MKNAELAHIWAQQRKKTGQGNNMYFDGPRIYSYGPHFQMAEHKGDHVLVTPRTYSATTAKHLSYVRGAISHLRVFNVPTFENADDNARDYIDRIIGAIAQLMVKRGEPRSLDVQNVWGLVAEARDYTASYASDVRGDRRETIQVLYFAIYGKAFSDWSFPPVLCLRLGTETRKLKQQRTIKTEANKARAAERRERARLAALSTDERRAMWRAGGAVSAAGPVMLRLSRDLKTIETSRGASVPVVEAAKLWAAICAGESVEGLRLGHYTVDHYDGVWLVAGCHTIVRSEIETMAHKLGLIKGVSK